VKVHGKLARVFVKLYLDIFAAYHKMYNNNSAIPVIGVNSGLQSQFTEWPASSAGTVLSCKVNGHGLSPTWAIFVTLHFQQFFVGRLGLTGLGSALGLVLQ